MGLGDWLRAREEEIKDAFAPTVKAIAELPEGLDRLDKAAGSAMHRGIADAENAVLGAPLATPKAPEPGNGKNVETIRC